MLIVAFTFASLQGEDPTNLQVPQGVGEKSPENSMRFQVLQVQKIHRFFFVIGLENSPEQKPGFQ